MTTMKLNIRSICIAMALVLAVAFGAMVLVQWWLDILMDLQHISPS